MFDLLFRSAIVVDGNGERPVTADVGVRDGLIADIGQLDGAAAHETIDATGAWLTPGDAGSLMADPARLEAALEAAIGRAMAEAAPDAVIIGGGPLAAAAAALRPRLAVPIVEPVPAAVALAVRRAARA